MKTKKPERTVIARVPDPLLKKLDRAAEKGRRSRSAELRIRLEESLERAPVLVAAFVPPA